MTNKQTKIYIGYFSNKMKEITGSIAYSTPSGEEVEITCIVEEGQPHNLKYDDVVCVGPVLKWQRLITHGAFRCFSVGGNKCDY